MALRAAPSVYNVYTGSLNVMSTMACYTVRPLTSRLEGLSVAALQIILEDADMTLPAEVGDVRILG